MLTKFMKENQPLTEKEKKILIMLFALAGLGLFFSLLLPFIL